MIRAARPQVRRVAAALALLALAAAPRPAPAAEPPPVDRIAAVLADPRGVAAPGCAAGVFHEGRTLFVASGAVDLATRRQADADTLFYAGSVSKQFTALAVAQLVVAGKLRLDQDVRAVLPEMRRSGPSITVAMLLHHTSGVPNSAKLEPILGLQKTGDALSAEIYAALLALPETDFPPGATFEYSNGGYLLLSLIVERVSGRPFADYVKANILEPLGMRRSFVMRGPPPPDADRAFGYAPKGDGYTASDDLPTFGGAGAMMLTIADLARYHHDIVAGHRVWTPQVARLMLAEARYPDGSPVVMPIPGAHFGYASGLMLSRDWVLHGGNYAGYQSILAWLPNTTYGVALLCNRSDARTLDLATRVMQAVDPALPPVDAPRYDLLPVTGRFVSDAAPVAYELATEGDGLRATVSGPDGAVRSTRTFHRTAADAYESPPLTLTFDPDHRAFRIANGPLTLRFHRAR